MKYQIDDLFKAVEKRQEASVPAIQTHVPPADQPDTVPLAGPVRLVADHPTCFYRGCKTERVSSWRSKHEDGKLLTCAEHRGPKYNPEAVWGKCAWINGLPEPGPRRPKLEVVKS